MANAMTEFNRKVIEELRAPRRVISGWIFAEVDPPCRTPGDDLQRTDRHQRGKFEDVGGYLCVRGTVVAKPLGPLVPKTPRIFAEDVVTVHRALVLSVTVAAQLTLGGSTPM